MDLFLSPGGRRYGAHFGPPKADDLGFPSHLVVRKGDWPKVAFLTGTIGPRTDQGQTSMCTGEGSKKLGERLYRRWKNQSPVFAPEFTYYLERKFEGTLSDGDCGAQVDTSLTVPDPAAGGIGWCPVNVTGYTPLDVTTEPSPAQLEAAKSYPGGARHTIGGIIANIKSCILSDYSGVVGVSVYESFESEETANSGLIPFPNINRESLLGGHEMHSLLGFDDSIQCPNSPNPGAVLTENSWGDQWGAKCPAVNLASGRGFAWLSYDYLMDRRLTSDVRMGHLGRAW